MYEILILCLYYLPIFISILPSVYVLQEQERIWSCNIGKHWLTAFMTIDRLWYCIFLNKIVFIVVQVEGLDSFVEVWCRIGCQFQNNQNFEETCMFTDWRANFKLEGGFVKQPILNAQPQHWANQSAKYDWNIKHKGHGRKHTFNILDFL